MRALGCVALWALCLYLPGPARATPTCRLDDREAALLSSTLAQVLPVLRRQAGAAAVPWDQVRVNQEGGGPHALRIELVRDARSGQGCPGKGQGRGMTSTGPAGGDLDLWSVPGLCKTDGHDRQVIRCSADGLRALTAEDRRRGRESPALLYVLAHELSHLRHGDRGHFLPPTRPIDLADPPKLKWQQIAEACDPRDEAAGADLQNERRADREALEVMDVVLQGWSRRDPAVDPAAARSLHILQIWVSSSALKDWLAGRYGGARLPGVVAEAMDPEPARVEWAVDRMICDILGKTRGQVLIPVYNSTHPLEAERLALVSSRLYASAPRPGPGAGGGQAQGIMAQLGGIDAQIDRQSSAFMLAFGEALCKRMDQGDRPDCGHVAAHPPEPPAQCPVFSGQVSAQPLVLSPREASVAVAGSSLRVPGQARTALPLPGGDVVIGLSDPGGVTVVSRSGGARTFALPCSPVAASTTAGGIALLCEKPFGHVRLDLAGGRARFFRLDQATYDGEAVTQEQLRGGFLGEVGGKLYATVHLPAAGKSTTVSLGEAQIASPAPWTGPACSRLFAGLGVWQLGPEGPVYGASWSSLAVRQAVRFDGDFRDMTALAAPSGEPAVFVCGPSRPLGRLVCADLGGSVFDPLAPGRTPLLRFPVSQGLRTSRVVRGRICSTGQTTYVMAVAPEGAGASTEVFAVDGHGGPSAKSARSIVQDARTEAELLCGEDQAVVLYPGIEQSEILRLPGS